MPDEWQDAREVTARLLGIRLREARLEADLLLPDAADRSGLAFGYIAECERGDKLPSMVALVALCDAYGLLVTELLTGVYPFGSRRRPRRLPPRPADGRRRPD